MSIEYTCSAPSSIVGLLETEERENAERLRRPAVDARAVRARARVADLRLLEGVTWAAPSSGRVTENPYGMRRTTPSRRRTMNPYWSAPTAELVALAVI